MSNEVFAFFDQAPCKGCKNPDSYGMICVCCGKCGRKFGKTIELSAEAQRDIDSLFDEEVQGDE